MITHGELDYRILASQGMMAFNAAQLRGIPSRMLVFPDENHWISKRRTVCFSARVLPLVRPMAQGACRAEAEPNK